MVPDRDAIQARCDALLGQVLSGRYRLDAVLGMGAMGAVFRARHTGLERDVALKLLHEELIDSEEMRARFAREAAAASKLDHPNCVRVTDFGSDGQHQYLVMELLQGQSLGDQVDEEPLPPLEAIQIVDEVLAGLEHAHGHGMVHRDIKPDNVFMARDEGGRARVKLLDFGIVKLTEQQGAQPLTKLGMIFGTPCYMSPEQALGGSVDARTDLYAVGIVLYLMLAGRLPFDSDDSLKVLRQQIKDPPPPLPASVPEPLREVAAQLLAKKPDERYASARAARNALALALQRIEGPAADASTAVVAKPGGAPLPPPPGLRPPSPAVAPPPAPPAAPAATAAPASAIAPPAVPSPAVAPSTAVSAVTPPPAPAPAPVSAVAPPPAPAPAPDPAPAPIAAPPAPPSSPGPAIVVPSHARPWWPPSWWPLGLDVRWVAGGVGVLLLVIVIVIATSGDDEEPQPPPPDSKAEAARDELAKLLSPSKAEGDEGGAAEDGGDAAAGDEGDEPQAAGKAKGGPSGLQATLESIDALLEAREFEAARITLGPLLEAHGGDAQLHWRMAKVLIALGGAENRALALESHASAISADAALLDDEAFTASLWALMDDPKLRTDAVDVALELLGSRADERLLQWLNVQTAPLAHAARQRIMAHLQQQGRGDGINRPLQRALDLWQARSAETPCETFASALREAGESPDSFLVGTLRAVPVPTVAPAEGGEPQPCPGAAEQLGEVRARHDEMFAGIDPVVPKAYRKRPAAKSSQRRR